MTISKESDLENEISDEDKKLIQEATQAFLVDHRYLESILWAAQARKSTDKK